MKAGQCIQIGPDANGDSDYVKIPEPASLTFPACASETESERELEENSQAEEKNKEPEEVRVPALTLYDDRKCKSAYSTVFKDGRDMSVCGLANFDGQLGAALGEFSMVITCQGAGAAIQYRSDPACTIPSELGDMEIDADTYARMKAGQCVQIGPDANGDSEYVKIPEPASLTFPACASETESERELEENSQAEEKNKEPEEVRVPALTLYDDRKCTSAYSTLFKDGRYMSVCGLANFDGELRAAFGEFS